MGRVMGLTCQELFLIKKQLWVVLRAKVWELRKPLILHRLAMVSMVLVVLDRQEVPLSLEVQVETRKMSFLVVDQMDYQAVDQIDFPEVDQMDCLEVDQIDFLLVDQMDCPEGVAQIGFLGVDQIDFLQVEAKQPLIVIREEAILLIKGKVVNKD